MVGSKGELVPDKTLEIAWYQHLLDTGGTSKYFSIFCIPKGTVGSKGELVPDKTLEIALYQHLFDTGGLHRTFLSCIP
jgi:hypothetical protein